MVSLKHISTLSTFNQTKFSADSTDSSYFLGSDQTQIFQGTPDVKYNDLCYIKCSNLQYTHGHLYGSTEVGEAHVSLTQEEYDALSEEEKNNGKIYLIKESTIPDLIDQLPLATTSTDGLMSAEDKEKLTNIVSGSKTVTGVSISFIQNCCATVVTINSYNPTDTSTQVFNFPTGFRRSINQIQRFPIVDGSGNWACWITVAANSNYIGMEIHSGVSLNTPFSFLILTQ